MAEDDADRRAKDVHRALMKLNLFICAPMATPPVDALATVEREIAAAIRAAVEAERERAARVVEVLATGAAFVEAVRDQDTFAIERLVAAAIREGTE
jgi:hypothetical protein